MVNKIDVDGDGTIGAVSLAARAVMSMFIVARALTTCCCPADRVRVACACLHHHANDQTLKSTYRCEGCAAAISLRSRTVLQWSLTLCVRVRLLRCSDDVYANEITRLGD